MAANFLISLTKPLEPLPKPDFDFGIDLDSFIGELRSRWRNVNIWDVSSDKGEPFQWDIQDSEGVSFMIGALFGNFAMVDGATKDILINFALLYRAVVPGEYPLYLYPEGYSDYIELHMDTTVEEINVEMTRKRFW